MRKFKFFIMLTLTCVPTLYAQDEVNPSRKIAVAFGEKNPAPLFSNHYEVMYGFGLSENNHYLGLNYTHRFDRFGISASAFKGIGNRSASLLAGPSYTFGMNRHGGNWQVYTGLGGTLNDSLSWAWQAGLRYCFNAGYLDNTETWSLSAGVSYINHVFVPTIGLSIVPTALKIGDWWGEKEGRYPHHYSELVGSLGVNGFMLGANYAYMPSKMGLYGSFLYGFDDDIIGTVGPVLRLNSSDNWPVDIQLFQGMGYHFHGENVNANGLCGETGIRFGFGRDRKYGMWSLSTSVIYSKGGAGVTLGMSWPIAGIAAASAGILLYAYAVATTGGDLPDVSNWGSSSSSSGGTISKNSTNTDCSLYMKKYAAQESEVVRLKKEYEDAKKYGTSMGAVQANKRLQHAKSKLRTIRREASAHHCPIPASSVEN